MRAVLAPSLLLALAGCATGSGSAARQGSLVVAEPPAAHCTSLGAMAVRTYSEVLMPEDALLSSAVGELQRRATQRGATHLVVDRAWTPAMVAWSNTARASGQAYRCDDGTR
ncbi:MAG: hypothetical protein ACXWLA_07860 [Myxococcaceae bacterium]